MAELSALLTTSTSCREFPVGRHEILNNFKPITWQNIPFHAYSTNEIFTVFTGRQHSLQWSGSRTFMGVPWDGASNDSGVVDNSNFQRFRGYIFGNFGDKTNIIIPIRSSLDNKSAYLRNGAG